MTGEPYDNRNCQSLFTYPRCTFRHQKRHLLVPIPMNPDPRASDFADRTLGTLSWVAASNPP